MLSVKSLLLHEMLAGAVFVIFFSVVKALLMYFPVWFHGSSFPVS